MVGCGKGEEQEEEEERGWLTKGGFKNGVARVSLHVVRGFVEISRPRNMVLPVLSNVISVVPDDDGGVPDDVSMNVIAFQNGRNNHHVVFFCQALEELGRAARFGFFGELHPRIFFSGAKSERHRCAREGWEGEKKKQGN